MEYTTLLSSYLPVLVPHQGMVSGQDSTVEYEVVGGNPPPVDRPSNFLCLSGNTFAPTKVMTTLQRRQNYFRYIVSGVSPLHQRDFPRLEAHRKTLRQTNTLSNAHHQFTKKVTPYAKRTLLLINCYKQNVCKFSLQAESFFSPPHRAVGLFTGHDINSDDAMYSLIAGTA